MKFKCDSRKLMEAIQTVIRVMAVRTPLEILDGILLDADEAGLSVTASDGNLTTVSRVDAEIITDGCAILPGRLLSEVIRKLPAGEIDASLSPKFVLTIRCGGSRFNISGRSAEEYPVPSDEGFIYDIGLPEPMLKEMIHDISFTVPLEDQRTILTGGFLNLKDGHIDMVGLDGFRMAMKSALISDVDRDAKAIIPSRALDEIEKLMSDDEEKTARLYFAQNRLKVESGSNKFYTSLIEGEYIDYKRVIPSSHTLTAKVDAKEFCSCIERAALIARTGRNNLIKVEVNEGEMVLSASSDAGDVREEISAQTNGVPLVISFNVRYLSDLARVINGDEICLTFGSSVTPCVITPSEGEDFLYLILPVRTTV